MSVTPDLQEVTEAVERLDTDSSKDEILSVVKMLTERVEAQSWRISELEAERAELRQTNAMFRRLVTQVPTDDHRAVHGVDDAFEDKDRDALKPATKATIDTVRETVERTDALDAEAAADTTRKKPGPKVNNDITQSMFVRCWALREAFESANSTPTGKQSVKVTDAKRKLEREWGFDFARTTVVNAFEGLVTDDPDREPDGFVACSMVGGKYGNVQGRNPDVQLRVDTSKATDTLRRVATKSDLDAMAAGLRAKMGEPDPAAREDDRELPGDGVDAAVTEQAVAEANALMNATPADE